MNSESVSIYREHYLNVSYGVRSWLFTKDHKRIALLFLASITLFFFLGGAFAVLIRLELLTPQGDLVQAETYNKLFTMHGIVMVFFFLIPSIPAVLGNFLLPLMIGARDVAFPRLNLASWYIFILGFSSILTGLNFIVTIHKMRAPGLTWFRLPLFVWSLYATSIIQVLATPVLAITLALMSVERFWGVGIFDPKLGGDPILFQHLFWFYSHPAVYIMILPGMGVISELITC